MPDGVLQFEPEVCYFVVDRSRALV